MKELSLNNSRICSYEQSVRYDVLPVVSSNAETVCLLSNRKPDSHIKLSLDMDEYYDIIEKEQAEKK